MPRYYVLIDKATGTVRGHTFSQTMYKPIEGEEVIIHNDEWPQDRDGIISQSSNYTLDKEKVRPKTQAEVDIGRMAR